MIIGCKLSTFGRWEIFTLSYLITDEHFYPFLFQFKKVSELLFEVKMSREAKCILLFIISDSIISDNRPENQIVICNLNNSKSL